MEHNANTYLFDIKLACNDIDTFTKNISLKKYSNDNMVKAAVERKFLVIGEAMTRLRNEFPQILNSISDHRKIIGFRNVLVHGYDLIDDATVWSAVKENLPILSKEVSDLLNR